MHPPTWLPLSVYSGNLDVVSVNFRTDPSLAFSAISQSLSVRLYGYKKLDTLVSKALTPFCSPPEQGEGIYLILQKFHFSQKLVEMSGSSGMLTQAYKPFLCRTQKGPVRLNSFSRHYVRKGTLFLSALKSLNLQCLLYLFYISIHFNLYSIKLHCLV